LDCIHLRSSKSPQFNTTAEVAAEVVLARRAKGQSDVEDSSHELGDQINASYWVSQINPSGWKYKYIER